MFLYCFCIDCYLPRAKLKTPRDLISTRSFSFLLFSVKENRTESSSLKYRLNLTKHLISSNFTHVWLVFSFYHKLSERPATLARQDKQKATCCRQSKDRPSTPRSCPARHTAHMASYISIQFYQSLLSFSRQVASLCQVAFRGVLVIQSFFFFLILTTDFPNDLTTSILEKEVETVAKEEKTYVEENSGSDV